MSAGGGHRRDPQLSLRRPDTWATLGLVLLVCATMAWSLDDALLVLGRDEVTDFLLWAVVGGVLAGAFGPIVGWGRWTTHLIGGAFAALVVALLVGWVLIPAGGEPATLFQATTDAVVGAWSDLVLAGRISTTEYGHHLLILGLLVWGTSLFASYAAFGHRRPMPAVVVIGLVLITNMSLTTRDQLTFMVIYSIGSLALLVRFHTLDEQADWLRRRIGDPAAISSLYLRGGSLFIVVAISGSLLLTNAASSAPLAGAWSDVGARFIEWGQFLERFLPPSRTGRPLGTSFGPNARVGKSWTTDDAIALRIELDPAETLEPYLMAAIYDRFELGGWTRSQDIQIGRAPTTDLLTGTGDAVPDDVLRPLQATIIPERSRREVFSPGLPGTIDQPVTLRLVGGAGFLHAVERESSDQPYTITALVPASEEDGGRTAARLRAAGTDYPAEIEALYGRATLPAGSIGPEARALLDRIVEEAASTNPYDLAVAIRDTLLDPDEFRYQTDVTDLRCDDPSVVECFALTRAGFCQYYASMMTVFLRDLGIPARFVQGFLPGTPDASGGGRTIRNLDAHAWVQVYFPGYGWEDFNPTGGTVPGLAPIPSGRPEASATPGPSGSGGAAPRDPTLRPDIDEPGGAIVGGPRGPQAGEVGLFIAFALVLAAVVGALAVAAWQRGPRGPVSADTVYGSIARLATRLGFGPRPDQTVYEYAGVLADQIPSVRPELETVARAKVEVAYGARVLGEDRIAGLREAHRRLRLGLLRLAVRRSRRRR